jgi:N-methylhydantoinase A/oxoprolinase/acetone carboxylase beta subunit
MRLGIDVGGTNTDVVLMSENGQLLAAAKQLTTEDILTGMSVAISSVLSESRILPDQVKGVFIGTTHVLNAMYSKKELARTALIRLTKQKMTLKPALDWPASLKSYIHSIYHLKSSNSYRGRKESDGFTTDLLKLFNAIERGEIDSVCIVGAYSPLYEQEEMLIKERIQEGFPTLPVTVSHKLGSIGFIERENSALLNAIISKVIRTALEGLSTIFNQHSFQCPYWLIQNNGSLMSIEEAIHYPILTIGSGVANSMRGAAVISGYTEFIAVDVGGSTIDIGLVKGSSPKEVINSSGLLGTGIHIPMPAVTSLPFGGGSIVSMKEGMVEIGNTVASDISKEGIAWGGKTWTVTDSFLKVFPDALLHEMKRINLLDSLPEKACRQVISYVMNEIKSTIERLIVNEEELPIVLVGGGSPLLHDSLFSKYKKIRKPSGFHICNAIGACFAPISEQIDKVYWLNELTKEEVVSRAVDTVRDAVIKKGGKPESVQIAYVEEFPFDYMQGEVLRVRTKAIGEMSL